MRMDDLSGRVPKKVLVDCLGRLPECIGVAMDLVVPSDGSELSEDVQLYVEHHLPILEVPKHAGSFPADGPPAERLLASLRPLSVWFSDDSPETLFCVDIGLGDEITQYRVGVYFDQCCEVVEMVMES